MRRHTVTVTLVRRMKNDEPDAYGNDVFVDVNIPVAGCVVWPADSNASIANERTDARETVLQGFAALLPPGTKVAALDAAILPGVDGSFEIVGPPVAWGPSPFTGRSAGVLITLRQVTG